MKKLKQEVEKKSSSTSVLFRCKLLQAADSLQVRVFNHFFVVLLEHLIKGYTANLFFLKLEL